MYESNMNWSTVCISIFIGACQNLVTVRKDIITILTQWPWLTFIFHCYNEFEQEPHILPRRNSKNRCIYIYLYLDMITYIYIYYTIPESQEIYIQFFTFLQFTKNSVLTESPTFLAFSRVSQDVVMPQVESFVGGPGRPSHNWVSSVEPDPFFSHCKSKKYIICLRTRVNGVLGLN